MCLAPPLLGVSHRSLILCTVASGSAPIMEIEAQLLAFKALVHAATPQASSLPTSKFVKNIDEIPSLELSPSDPC